MKEFDFILSSPLNNYGEYFKIWLNIKKYNFILEERAIQDLCIDQGIDLDLSGDVHAKS